MRWVLLALFIVFIFLSVWWDMSLILLGFSCGAIVVLVLDHHLFSFVSVVFFQVVYGMRGHGEFKRITE